MISITKRAAGAVPNALTDMLTMFPDLSGTWQVKDELGNVIPFSTELYEDVTYAQLVAKRIASEFAIGKVYRITDYKTVYAVSGTGGLVVLSGASDPLCVQAISLNKLSPIASSLSYPSDIIYYELVPTVGVRNCTVNNKGVIKYRIDSITNNSYPADFRAMIVRRWDDGLGNYTVTADNSNAYLDYAIFAAGCVNNKFEPLSEALKTIYGLTDDVPNTCLFATSSDNYFSGMNYNVVFTDSIRYSNLSGSCYESVFMGTVTSLHNYGSIVGCTFGGQISKLDVNGDVSYSQFDGTLTNVVLGAYVNLCTFAGTITDSSFKTVAAQVSVSGNILNAHIDTVAFSTFSSTVTDVIGDSILSCIFTGDFSNCTFKKLNNITFLGVCQDNTFQSYMNPSGVLTVGLQFTGNKFFASVSDTSFGDNCINNVFMHNVLTCLFGDITQHNTFGGEVSNSSFVGGVNGFIYNTFGNSVAAATIDTITTFDHNVFSGMISTFDVNTVDSFASCSFSGFVSGVIVQNATSFSNNSFGGRVSDVTFDGATFSYVTVSGAMVSSSINVSLTRVSINGGCSGLSITNTCSDFNNVSFVTGITSATFATGGGSLTASTTYTEMVNDDNTSGWLERYINSAVYVYAVVA
jgi:hypothetical protein